MAAIVGGASLVEGASLVDGERGLLRFITCGSVDDGKSTLIGRLLHDTGSVPDDVLAAARRDSGRWGTTGEDLDLALLVDGLHAEREQRITIDVAYRYFATARRRFVLADTPGHEQYTRNMATGASGADLAVLLVDASRGLQPQTRRHAWIVRQFGIRRVVVALNKMDRVDWSRAAFGRLEEEARAALAPLGFDSLEVVPLSALTGDHVVTRSARMPWHAGPTLLEVLERVPLPRAPAGDLRLPVQWVTRPDAAFRGYAGTIARGRVSVGDALVALPSGIRGVVRTVDAPDGARTEALAGEAVTITFVDDLDVTRGQVLAPAGAPATIARRIAADVLWMADAPLVPGARYELKFAHRYVGASVARLVHRIDVAGYVPQDAAALGLNDLGRCEFALAEPVLVDAFELAPVTGSFLVIDLDTHATVGAGLVRGVPAANGAHAGPVTRQHRAAQKRQRPFVLWLTGLSGAGKTTVAAAAERALTAAGHHTYLLDGDRMREALNRDLGYGELDRRENLRRLVEVAATLVDAGLIVLVASIAPYAADRARARERLGADYVEVFVDASLAECERRDPKGHYRRARSGALAGFTGVDAPYEVPAEPELRLDTAATDADGAARQLLEYLVRAGRLERSVMDADWVI